MCRDIAGPKMVVALVGLLNGLMLIQMFRFKHILFVYFVHRTTYKDI